VSAKNNCDTHGRMHTWGFSMVGLLFSLLFSTGQTAVKRSWWGFSATHFQTSYG